MNAIKLFILDICLYVNKWALRTSTGREREELIQIWLRDISSCDPEATEPALGVYPWYASDPESYTPDTFQGNFRLRTQRCWDYYGDPDNVEPRLPPEPYDVDPKLFSALEKLEKSKRLQRNPRKHLQERCRIILLPYLEAAVERFEKGRTVAGKYELRYCTTKVKDMYHPFHMETRRLIVSSCHTITFTNPEGKRRDLLAVVVAEERWGDAYNPLLAYMGIVHRNRKDRGEKNSVVYGIATDGYTFQIAKIDNKSKQFQSCEYSLDEGWGFFLKYLDDILTEAPGQCEE
ncbi:hypothetical protein CNMCM8980_010105 [Aspergillus fumigatiaffinis]|uniref:Uncharacterized protein n=1 Tax=Aspergillus fumigatiaffinis TaxID=340414 RepID=A0A8H4HG35_9EURO|nr:hypothetical protein CNMCM6805_002053 [Aspergillus fumigatiaffinis]KAF4250783.1 hypothetical protein CNMCM8980_010105 [Aspergillus fumigatiaffinis]